MPSLLGHCKLLIHYVSVLVLMEDFASNVHSDLGMTFLIDCAKKLMITVKHGMQLMEIA